MDAKLLVMLNLGGMGLNLVGFLLLFWFGVPFKSRGGGEVHLTWGVDQAEKKLETRYDVASWAGLASAIVGAVLQAWVTARQGGLL